MNYKIHGIEIDTYNDKKEKRYSWEADFEKLAGATQQNGFGKIEAKGYGATEEEAIEDLESIIKTLTTHKQDNTQETNEADKGIQLPDDQQLKLKYAIGPNDQPMLVIELEGSEEHAWILSPMDVIAIAGNPQGVMVGHAKRPGQIQTPGEKKIILS